MYATVSEPDEATTLRTPEADDQDVDPRTVLTALDDRGCRKILEATAEKALTASELSTRCSIPLSTIYRKLELLTDAALLEEQVRINETGKHASEYRQCFDDVTVSVSGENQVAVTVSQSSGRM